MVKNTAFRRILTFSAAAVMTLSLVACGGGNNAAAPSSKAATSVAAGSSAAASSAASSAVSSAASSAASDKAELSADQIKDLMKQVAEAELEQQYKDAVKAENDYRFANAEVFGIDRTGNSGKMYVYLNTGEYVNFKGKAYFMSGGSGEAIINIEYGDKIKLNKVDWSDSGAGHDKWVKNNFPKAYYEKCQEYKSHDDNGKSNLAKAMEAEVEKAIGVPVEQSNLLTIDRDAKTYEIVQTKESGTPGTDYKFETITIDKGKL